MDNDKNITYVDSDKIIIGIAEHILRAYDCVVGMYLGEQVTHIANACHKILIAGGASVDYDHIKNLVARCVYDYHDSFYE